MGAKPTNNASINFRVPAHVAEQVRTEAARCEVTVGSLLRKIVDGHFKLLRDKQAGYKTFAEFADEVLLPDQYTTVVSDNGKVQP